MKKFKLKSTISIRKAGPGSLKVKVEDSGSHSEQVIGLEHPAEELMNHDGIDYFDENTLARVLYEAKSANQGLTDKEYGRLQEILRNGEFVECVD